METVLVTGGAGFIGSHTCKALAAQGFLAGAFVGSILRSGALNRLRDLLAHAPKRLHEEISADYTDMIYAATPEEIEKRCKAFIAKSRLKHRAVADSLEQAGQRLFTFTRLPPSQWRSVRATDAIEQVHDQAARQDADRAAIRRHSRDAVLGAARLSATAPHKFQHKSIRHLTKRHCLSLPTRLSLA